MPILDGGYSLQYSPLMEYREGKGMVLFCQMDVTGRTESDPAAETLAGNIFRYVSAGGNRPQQTGRRSTPAIRPAKRHLEHVRHRHRPPTRAGSSRPTRSSSSGPAAGRRWPRTPQAVETFLKAGGSVLALGLDEEEANSFLPGGADEEGGAHRRLLRAVRRGFAAGGHRPGGCP